MAVNGMYYFGCFISLYLTLRTLFCGGSGQSSLTVISYGIWLVGSGWPRLIAVCGGHGLVIALCIWIIALIDT